MGVTVRLLGGFGVAVDGADVDAKAWPSRRAAQLVALLALDPRRRLTSDQVMDALWPELDADAARANLHKAATYARRALGSRDAIVLRGGTVALFPDAEVHVDAVEFEAAAEAALATDDGRACGDALDRHAGDLLADELYEEWTIATRDRLQRLHRDLLRRAGRWEDLVEVDATDEEAHRGLMAEHHRAGRLHAAIRQFQRLRAVLARELHVAPSDETLRLYRSIIGSSSAGWSRPALVGREVELVRARAALRRAGEDRAAAVLVTGPAGIGKTRLCEELVDQAEMDGWFALRAAATEESGAVPYGPLLEAMETIVLQDQQVAANLDPTDRDLLLRLAARDDSVSLAHRHTVVRLLARVVRAAGARRAVLFVDDLHLADEATVASSLAADDARPGTGAAGVVASRLARVSQEARDALRSTALVTDEFDADVVAALAGISPDAALAVLQDATAAEIVATRDAAYRFRHDLVRERLVADADGEERRSAHAALAAWLAGKGATPGRVAHHLVAAGRDQEAVPFLRAAAGHALAVGAHRDAVSLAESGLAVAPRDAELLGLRADGLFGAGDPGAAAAYAVAIAASDGAARRPGRAPRPRAHPDRRHPCRPGDTRLAPRHRRGHRGPVPRHPGYRRLVQR